MQKTMEISKLKEKTQHMVEAFLILENKDEIFNFLRDLLTENEILEFTQRLEIAKKLSQWISYIQIEKTTGASSTTIARVTKFLHGEFGGYQNIFKKLLKQRTQSE